MNGVTDQQLRAVGEFTLEFNQLEWGIERWCSILMQCRSEYVADVILLHQHSLNSKVELLRCVVESHQKNLSIEGSAAARVLACCGQIKTLSNNRNSVVHSTKVLDGSAKFRFENRSRIVPSSPEILTGLAKQSEDLLDELLASCSGFHDVIEIAQKARS